jgi:hypothetical protein
VNKTNPAPANAEAGQRPEHAATEASIAQGYGRNANKVLAGSINKTDIVPSHGGPIMKSRGSLASVMKRLGQLPVKTAKRSVRANASSPPKVRDIRRNDPLAIGIEELERCFWRHDRRSRGSAR